MSLGSVPASSALHGVRSRVGSAWFKLIGENSSKENVCNTKLMGYQRKIKTTAATSGRRNSVPARNPSDTRNVSTRLTSAAAQIAPYQVTVSAATGRLANAPKITHGVMTRKNTANTVTTRAAQLASKYSWRVIGRLRIPSANASSREPVTGLIPNSTTIRNQGNTRKGNSNEPISTAVCNWPQAAASDSSANSPAAISHSRTSQPDHRLPNSYCRIASAGISAVPLFELESPESMRLVLLK